MNPFELASGIALVAILLGLAGFFAWRQFRTLRLVKNDPSLSPEDRHYLLGQVKRRLLSSFLMVIFAGFLVGSYFLDADFRRLHGELDQPPAWPEDEAASKDFLRFFTWYWISALMVLLAIVLLAAVDFASTARFGARHQRQLLDDHRAMLQSEAERLRRQRDEMN